MWRLWQYLLAILMLAGSLLPAQNPPAAPAMDYTPDVLLYKHITERVAGGQGYYSAAATEHREHGFQMRPFVVVRPPMFAWLSAALYLEPLQCLLLAICIAAFATIPGLKSWERLLAALTVLFGGWHALIGPQWIHEYWAGILLGISFALYRPDRWWIALPPALLAALLRELAVPFLCLAASFAAYNRRWVELAGWGAALLVVAAYLCFHAFSVMQVTLSSDATSDGWGQMIGYTAALQMVARQSLLVLLPDQWGQFIVALSIFGWLGLRNRAGTFAFLYCGGMVLLLSVGARFNNTFWALLVFPIWAGGIAFLPRLLTYLIKSSKPPQQALSGARANGRGRE